MTVGFFKSILRLLARSLSCAAGHMALRHLACRLVSTRFHQSAKSGSDASARHVRTKKGGAPELPPPPLPLQLDAPLRPQQALPRCPGPMAGQRHCGSCAIAVLPACLSTDLASMTNHDDSDCDPIPSLCSHLEYPQQKLCCGFVFTSCSSPDPIFIPLRFVLKHFRMHFKDFTLRFSLLIVHFRQQFSNLLGFFFVDSNW